MDINKIIVIFLVVIIFPACTNTQEEKKILPVKIKITNDILWIFDKDKMPLNSVSYDKDGNEIKNLKVDYYCDGVKLDSNIFSSSIAGTHSIVAKYGDTESEPYNIQILVIYKFEEPKLEERIKFVAGISSYITDYDAKNIDFIDIDKSCDGITSLKGIEKLVNVETVTFHQLDFFKIKDYEPLYQLPKLKELHIGDGNIGDMSFLDLKKLKNVSILSITEANITELKNLENLENLETLYIKLSNLKNLNFAKNMKNLKKLYCEEDEITDISGALGLSSATQISVASNKVTDISVFGKMPSLKGINVSENDIRTLDAIKDATNITGVDAENCNLTDIKALSKLNLVGLVIKNNNVTSFEGIENSTNIGLIDAQNTMISSLELISKFTNMHLLRMKGSRLRDLSPIKNYRNCEIWVLSDMIDSKQSPNKEIISLLLQQGCVIR